VSEAPAEDVPEAGPGEKSGRTSFSLSRRQEAVLPTFTIEGDCRGALARIFETGDDGRLTFGWNGRSLAPAKLDDLISGPVGFCDYLMEGFVFYEIRAEDRTSSCLLNIRGRGSNRDEYIRPHFRHIINLAGLVILAEADDPEITDDIPSRSNPATGPSCLVADVIDAFEAKSAVVAGSVPGLVVVLDAFRPPEPQQYVDRPVVIRTAESEPRFARIGAVRDHGATISFFFQNLTMADVPIGSRVEFEA